MPSVAPLSESEVAALPESPPHYVAIMNKDGIGRGDSASGFHELGMKQKYLKMTQSLARGTKYDLDP